MAPDRIRVLQLIWRLTDHGGVPAVGRTLLSQLDPDRFDAHALCVRPGFGEDRIDLLGRHVTVHSLGYVGKHTRSARAVLALRMVSKVRAIAPDLIHTHSGSAWMSLPSALAHPRATRLIDVHDAPFTGKHGRWTDWAEMALIRGGGYHPVVHSSSVRTDTAAALRRHVDRLSLIPLGVQPRARQPEAGTDFRRRFDIPAADQLVIYTGDAPTKNVPLFLKVARRVRTELTGGVTFAVIGRQTQQTIEDARRCEVRLLGIQPSIVPALEAADVFLSTADYEGFGLAITEAMYTGVPVVSTAVGGVVDQVVDGVTGFLAPQGDERRLAARTVTLLTDYELRRRMGSDARRHVEEHFTTTRVTHEFERLYERLAPPLPRHSSRPPQAAGDPW